MAADSPTRRRTLDRNALLERLEGDQDLLLEIVELFLEDCPRRLGLGRSAIAAGDMHTLVRIAHSLKGSAANFGGTEASAAALAVETAARAEDLAGATAAWSRLEAEIAWLTAALRDWD